MQRFKKAIVFMAIAVSAISNVSIQAQAKQVGTVFGYPIFDNKFGEMEITDGGSNTDIINRKASFQSKYDPRELGLVTAVEAQGATNTCWAFATNAAIEANLLKKGYENSSVNLSENHLAYFYYNRETDPLGYTKGDQNLIPSFTKWSMNGGTLYGTALALSTWAGVVKDTVPTSEDDAKGQYVPFDIVDKSTCYKSDYVVKNVYMYDYSVSTVKQAIMDYGAVACGIYIDENNAYFSSDEKSYYYPKEGGNHAVTIVGWDDTYSRDNFNGAAKPRVNGAWIVKNSWGSNVHDGGYMYVSYEDKSLCEIVAYDMMSASERDDNNYQHDGTANPAYSFKRYGSITAANVFKAKGSSSGYNELLEAVSVCTYTANVNYSLQIYTGVTGSTNPTKGKAMFSNPKKGMLTHAGYNRIELNTPVTLTAGEKYAVVITLSAANGGEVSLCVEASYRNSAFSFLADVGSGEGFIKNNDKWYDYGDIYTVGSENLCNLRIKAYTSNTEQKTSYQLSSKNMGLSKGSSAKLSLKTTPSSVKRKVTWSSSNKKVAKVSSSGKVTGKGYGKATIKAKFVAGGNTKTLKCTVTVGPSKIKDFKAQGAKKKIKVTWKKNDEASGYEVSYSEKKDGEYKKLATIKSGSTTKCSKSLKKGTYYVKMRPYMTKDGKKLYGSYTSPKKVTVK